MPHSLLPGLDRQLAADELPLDSFRACIKESIPALARRFHAGEPVEALVTARAEFIDQILHRAWQQFLPPDAEVALAAVGGYGRGELHPASDVDVLILCRHEPAGALVTSLEQFITFLWDIGLEIGQSVRTLSQCVENAEADITIATNLMESRWLAGEESLFKEMREATGPDKIWPSDKFFTAKYEEQRKRHRKYEDTAYNLEPNIKSNPGGLRDIQMIGWVVKRHFGAETLTELVAHGFLTETEYQQLIEGQSLLWKIRFALHLITGRHDDRLSFEYQRSIARDFGYCDKDGNLAVEQFMQRYYLTVLRLNRLNEMLLQLFQTAILHGNRPVSITRINNRFQANDGFLEIRNNGIFARYPIAMLEMFLLLEQHPELKGVQASTIRLVRAHRHLIDDAFRRDIRARSLFMEILKQPEGVTHALRRMNRYGILARYVPEFGNIVGRMQFDLFHVYTVDEHTLRVIRNLRRFAIAEHKHEFPLCSGVFGQLPKPELLYITGLFHDIAKGRGGDHAELGAIDAHRFCKLHDLSDYDADLVSWLVKYHLHMSKTAQKKDIEDPNVVQEFAQLLGDPVRLDYLYLLTVADIRATDPRKWNSWKASLLDRLYHTTRQALLRGLNNPQDQIELIEEKQNEARGQLIGKGFSASEVTDLWLTLNIEYFLLNTPDEMVWHAEKMLSQENRLLPSVSIRKSVRRGCDEIFICRENRDHLFAQTSALLDQLQLNVLEARIRTTSNKLSANSFYVLEKDGNHITGGSRVEEIIAALEQNLESPVYSGKSTPHRLPRKIEQFNIATEIDVSQDSEALRTEIHISTADRPGLLSAVGEVFTEQNIRVQNAKITTLGAVAEDVFYVTDQSDAPLTSENELDQLVNQLKQRLAD